MASFALTGPAAPARTAAPIRAERTSRLSFTAAIAPKARQLSFGSTGPFRGASGMAKRVSVLQVNAVQLGVPESMMEDGNCVPITDKFGISVVSPTILPEDLAAALTRAPSCELMPKKTHIVCTLGPSTRTPEQIAALLSKGMSVARFNFSHGSHDYHLETFENLIAAEKLSGNRCAALLDTKGPEIRTGMFEESLGGKVTIEKGDVITLTTDYEAKGNANLLAISYKSLARDVEEGMRILLADGSLVLEVLSTDEAAGTVEARAINQATIGERKNCNLPGVKVDLPILTEKDKEDLLWGVEHHVDFVAASFVRKGDDVRYIRDFLDKAGGADIQIISKVENQEGLENFDDILELSNGIMVAPVVTATQMLDSMIANPRPTRAEATDVANAVLDGTDCVMLSGETAAGAFPMESVEIMSSICEEAERCIDNYAISQNMMRSMLTQGKMTTIESLSSSAVVTAEQIGARLIVVLAASGIAARLIAKYRPGCPVVVGVVPRERRSKIGFKARGVSSERVANQLMLTRGLVPVVVSRQDDHDEDPAAAAKRCVDEAVADAKAQGLVKSGDSIVSMYNVERQCAVIRVVICP